MDDDAWVATWRLQLHQGFPLKAAEEILPDLAALGVSHVYLSPCLRAAPGSAHGYDVADPSRVSEDLGGEAAWASFCGAAKAHGLGVLLDIVPNHMAASPRNPWWEDVMRHGPWSGFAHFFDIERSPEDGCWRLHFATLGRPYCEALEAGELKIVKRDGLPALEYFDNVFPLTPASWSALLPRGAEAPEFDELRRLVRVCAPKETDRALYRELVALAEARLRRTDFLEAAERINSRPEELHELLRRQFYALHYWKLAGEKGNYRRFFDVATLAGLRVELDDVFDAAHARVARMIEDRQLAGLRVDHPDGLRDPEGYLRRLRALLPGGRVYVEKILEDRELLREEWPVDGTVGYEFLSKINRLWMREENVDALTAAYADFTGRGVNYPEIVRECKRRVAEKYFSGDIDRLAKLAEESARLSWRFADLTRAQIRRAVEATVTSMPVYRSYLGKGPARPADARALQEMFGAARLCLTEEDGPALDLLEEILTRKRRGAPEREFVARWQQTTPAVMAKGVEDTAFYGFTRLTSANEVGASPSLTGISPDRLHAFFHHLLKRWPRNLLATSTHDNKRSEDARCRISVLTEIPAAWAEAVREWSRMNAGAWHGARADRHAEWLLYQTLVGAWPLDFERCWNYMLKAQREAKLGTSWHDPDFVYEEALRRFIEEILQSREFTESLERFVKPLIYPGRVNSLAQTLVKITAPGVPDFYQGTDLWDLSLVDPDNRRPVDYERRGELLALRDLPVEEVTKRWDDGLPKQWMIARALRTRREMPECFSREGAYHALTAVGERMEHLFGFVRGGRALTLVPRFTLSLGGEWEDTRVRLPPGVWENRFTGVKLEGDLPPDEIFGAFPVALLIRQP